jgi:hypothetical protein
MLIKATRKKSFFQLPAGQMLPKIGPPTLLESVALHHVDEA